MTLASAELPISGLVLQRNSPAVNRFGPSSQLAVVEPGLIRAAHFETLSSPQRR